MNKQELINNIEQDRQQLEQIKNDLQVVKNDLQQNKLDLIKLSCIKDDLNIIDLLLKHDFKKLSHYNLKLTEHTGKLKGLESLSTLKTINQLCLHYSQIGGAVCFHCYVNKYLKMYSQLEYSLLYNTLILKYTELQPQQLLNINAKYFRFESFSDLHNMTHLKNLIKIAKYNNGVNFGLWSKNYNLILSYLKNYKMPKNINLIISSIFLNGVISENYCNRLLKTGNIKKEQLKVFTVYDKKTIEHDNIIINCGGKSCLNCGLCYRKNKTMFLNEVLK